MHGNVPVGVVLASEWARGLRGGGDGKTHAVTGAAGAATLAKSRKPDQCNSSLRCALLSMTGNLERKMGKKNSKCESSTDIQLYFLF